MDVDLRGLEAAIIKIGRDLVACDNNCEGVCNKKDDGILPRCLYPEFGEDGEKGCIIVGHNPGISSRNEREAYIKYKNGGVLDYGKLVEYWGNNIKDKHQYYLRLRGIVREMGFDGPILWTELVKCEKENSELKELPVETIRNCIKKYLYKEIETTDNNWQIFAIGRISFNVLSFRFPNSPIIGIPHPTGSRGDFWLLFQNNSRNNPLKEGIRKAIREIGKKAIWLRG